MTRIGLITARGGSKSIPRKNIKTLAGKPLIYWTIEAALNANSIDRVIVSTDDHEIATISLSYKAEVPFIRPNQLASDTSPSIDTVIHALEEIPEANDIFLLQPTSPFRNSQDIDAIFSLRESIGVSTAVSVTPTKTPPEWMYRIVGNKMINYSPELKPLRRQDLEQSYQVNGAIYLATRAHLEQKKSFISNNTVPYIMCQDRSIDIDTMIDWKLAEVLSNIII